MIIIYEIIWTKGVQWLPNLLPTGQTSTSDTRHGYATLTYAQWRVLPIKGLACTRIENAYLSYKERCGEKKQRIRTLALFV